MATTFTYAEELTLTNLRALVLRKLRVLDTTRYSPTQGTADYDWVDDALNMALVTFVRETKCLRGYAVYVPIAEFQFYRLPESFIDLEAAYYFDASLGDGYQQLIIKDTKELDEAYSDWRTDIGTPKYIAVDRMFGRRWFFGLAPIPSNAGTAVTFDATYGSKLTDICSLTTYNEEFIELPQTGEFYCPTSDSGPGKISNMDKDVLLITHRLPRQLDTTSQYPEVPREYHRALASGAASDLLSNNPEDTAEYKRSIMLGREFKGEIESFKKQRRKPFRGHSLQARPKVWSWIDGMEYTQDLP